MKTVIILAAGSGSRCNLGYNKLLYKISNKMLIEYTLEKFKGYDIIITVSAVDYELFVKKFPNYKIVLGGKTRQESVYKAMLICESENILIHDGARIFVDTDTILRVENALTDVVAVLPSVVVKDSIKDQNGKNIDRSNIYIAQTPQGVKRSVYLSCIDKECSDDVTVIEKCGFEVVMVNGSYSNIKITTIEDLEYAKFKLGGNNDL
ncbi:MAG: IspD/TarI family cytidylyltransferase [Bacilli bacterium]